MKNKIRILFYTLTAHERFTRFPVLKSSGESDPNDYFSNSAVVRNSHAIEISVRRVILSRAKEAIARVFFSFFFAPIEWNGNRWDGHSWLVISNNLLKSNVLSLQVMSMGGVQSPQRVHIGLRTGIDCCIISFTLSIPFFVRPPSSTRHSLTVHIPNLSWCRYIIRVRNFRLLHVSIELTQFYGNEKRGRFV